ncbi:MAG TPA: ferredoxin [Planctomycetaceae bacterium]|nr:ferredoxin [Planctomycetaceae bacterium]
MSWHQAASIDQLEASGALEILVEQRVIALFLIDNTIHAVDGMCAHQGGPIASGKVAGNCVTCPWHGWQYDVRNGTNLLTGKQMLETFATRVEDGQIWVELPSS